MAASVFEHMKLTRSLILQIRGFLVFAAVLVWLFVHSGFVLHTKKTNAPNREALVRIHQEIQVGFSRADVQDAFRRLGTPDLKLHQARETDWLIAAPSNLDASNWELTIDFKNGNVVRVRLLDDDGQLPTGGPPDKEEHEPNAAPVVSPLAEQRKPPG